MKSILPILLALVASQVACETYDNDRALQLLGEIPYDPSVDYCKIGEADDGQNQYGDCNPEIHFPTCDSDSKHCYHRTNRRDMWYDDDKQQPHYYIDPRRVICVLNRVQCITCTPGRYCLSKMRCILDDEKYSDCDTWY
ncbi:hypothetical protein MHU86_10385 [Fragilaria crotonensis]|nr:hypothetical protein MHU86_10385 [Fragilaria crotonensis]